MPGYLMSEELKRTVQQVCLQFLNSFQPRPTRGRRLQRRGGGGGPGKTAIVQATAVIGPATAGPPRVATTSTDFTTIKGDTFSEIENWSLVSISDDSFLIIQEIDGDGVIVSAFC